MLRLPLSVGSEFISPAASCTLARFHVVDRTQRRGRRRTTTPPINVPPVYEKRLGERIDPSNRELLARVVDAEKRLASCREQVEEKESRTMAVSHKQRRVGLIVQKIGMTAQWKNDGSRMLCTMLHVPSNHVVSVTSPEEWFARSLVGKRKAFNRDGPLYKVTVGAVDGEPHKFTSVYRSQFTKSGVGVKEKLASFLVSPDALPSEGKALEARHFEVGQYVTATGRSIDWGFQGGMHRWGMRGQPQRRTTKSHRRIGSVGSVGDARIWPGKRMPGHMGWEWVTLSGIQIVRMNVDKQVVYVKGNVPGDVGEWLLLKDCLQEGKSAKAAPVPTWSPSLPTIPEAEGEKEEADEGKATTEHFIPDLFRFTSPSLSFDVSDAKKQAGRDKTKAKIAKVKK